MREQNLGRGHSIQGFDSTEEMIEYVKEQERQSNADALPEQFAINWGDRVIRVVDDLAIWGHIYTWDEFLKDNTEAGQQSDEEILLELEGLKDAHLRGYRYGRWYSEVEPDGEYGSAHVVSLWPITWSDFEVARRNEWHTWPEIALRIQAEVRAAYEKKERDEHAQE